MVVWTQVLFSSNSLVLYLFYFALVLGSFLSQQWIKDKYVTHYSLKEK